MNTKEMDIVRVCREILELRDQSADLSIRSYDLRNQSIAKDKKIEQAIAALASLVGQKFEPQAFQTFDPTDGRSIIVVVGKGSQTEPYVRRHEILKDLGAEDGGKPDGEK